MTIGTYRPPHCRARRTNGEPCSAFPIHGGTVCISHGGAAPQVKQAAADRIADLVPTAIQALERAMTDPDRLVRSSAVAAARDLLDRAGHGAKQRVEVEVRIRSMARDLGLDEDEAVLEAARILELPSGRP